MKPKYIIFNKRIKLTCFRDPAIHMSNTLSDTYKKDKQNMQVYFDLNIYFKVINRNRFFACT